MTVDGIRVERDGPVATIWLDRPAKRNAMSYAMWAGLGDACVELGDDTSVRVVVLRGAGGHFCAGADIGELLAERPADAPTFHQVNVTAEHALANLPKPTVAFVEGDCIGGGCALAIDCDLRLAVDGARFGITPAKLGVVYPAASHERVGRLLGPAAAKMLLFTGRLVDTATALRIGLVDEVHEPGAGESALAALCAELAERSLLSQVASKEMIAQVAATGSVPEHLERHWAQVAAGAGDLREGVAAFAERRPPKFTWAG
ncbi:MAG: enoyl-CoA hydratase/isomerase family protein [Ilumatobacteraceae bacterium]